MKNLSLDHPYIQLYNQSKIILCVGQGAWEDEMLASTHNMQKLFQEKGISAWCDFWGKDVNHDWPLVAYPAPLFHEIYSRLTSALRFFFTFERDILI